MPDRAATPVVSRVSYRVSGGTLQRAFGLASAGNADELGHDRPQRHERTPFTYRDINDNATTLPAQVRTVNISLTFATAIGRGTDLHVQLQRLPEDDPMTSLLHRLRREDGFAMATSCSSAPSSSPSR